MKIEVYTKEHCPNCETVKRYLDGRGVEYAERDAAAPGPPPAPGRLPGRRRRPHPGPGRHRARHRPATGHVPHRARLDPDAPHDRPITVPRHLLEDLARERETILDALRDGPRIESWQYESLDRAIEDLVPWDGIEEP